jgi:hypothetical protein
MLAQFRRFRSHGGVIMLPKRNDLSIRKGSGGSLKRSLGMVPHIRACHPQGLRP